MSRWPTILGVCIALTALMMLTVMLRIYVRARLIKNMGIDDYVMLFSCVCSIVYNGLCISQSRYGLGLPIKLRPKANLNKYSEINFSGRPFYMAGITGFKVALCFAYLRITGSNLNSRYRRVIWGFMVFAILTHLGGTLVLIFQCRPIHKSWRPLTPGYCLPNDITFYTLAGMTIFCDMGIFLLPIPLLMRVQINLRRKIGLIGIFSLGLFTTVCSVLRMVQITTIAKTGDSTMLVLWGTIEMNVGIFLTCLPSLTPLFTFFANKAKHSRYGLYYGPTKDTYTNNSVQLHKVTNASQNSDSTAFQRSDSEEHIMPVGTKPDFLITKTTTTEVEIHEGDKEGQEYGRKRW